MKFNHNPFYSPEKCGLRIVAEEDTGESWQFDKFVVWAKEDDKTLWYDSDSGCSCPVPFDIGRHDLRSLTEETFYNFKEALTHHSHISPERVEVILRQVRELLG